MTDYLLTYDVSTQDKAGRRRLRRMAQLCSDYGQRVQLSVFECAIDDVQFEALMARAAEIINPAADSLRVYRLPGGRKAAIRVLGRDGYVDFNDVLVV